MYYIKKIKTSEQSTLYRTAAHLDVIQPVCGLDVGQPFTVVNRWKHNLPKLSQTVNKQNSHQLQTDTSMYSSSNIELVNPILVVQADLQ